VASYNVTLKHPGVFLKTLDNQSQAAVEVLQICAMLAADTIPWELLRKMFQEVGKKDGQYILLLVLLYPKHNL
jgi:hypothetical protein